MGDPSIKTSSVHPPSRGTIRRSGGRRLVEVSWLLAVVLGVAGIAIALQPIQSDRNNFFAPGTQPNVLFATGGPGDPIRQLISPGNCQFCHADYDPETAPLNKWAHSMMAQSGRDPIFHAALSIAEQDAAFVGESCLRCHTPSTWLSGQVKFDSDPMSESYGKHLSLSGQQLLGVNCSVCHRMVDPLNLPGAPAADAAILAALASGAPAQPGNANLVIDPLDRRRGPYDLAADWAAQGGWPNYHAFLQSPFHTSSRHCASCHDVSLQHFTKQADGSYALNPQGSPPHPDKYMQFPEQRTFSEWSQSLFAFQPMSLPQWRNPATGLLEKRFGGNSLLVSSCQDCHMPDTSGEACALGPPVRNNIAKHEFLGANNWVLKAVRDLYPDSETFMSESDTLQAIALNEQFVARSSDMELTAQRGRVNVRIINFTGHKLPTGYSEGRRMWINVKFKNAAGTVIAERGNYNPLTGALSQLDTKVYEKRIGPDATLAALVGTTAGPNFRLAISNKVYKDNRIPPMGFINAFFESVQAGSTPPGQYADGQYWDDTPFAFPTGARSAEVSVFYQITTKEYIESLRDNNTSDGNGTTAFNLWVTHGRSPPILMDQATINFECACDWNGDGQVSVPDIFAFLDSWFNGIGDFDNNGLSEVPDIFNFLSCWFAGCVGF